MRAPRCRLCGKEHWGDCDLAAPKEAKQQKENPAPKTPAAPPQKTKAPRKKKTEKKKSAASRPRGRPPASEAHLTNEKRKPWEKEGISRRSWYRKKADKK